MQIWREKFSVHVRLVKRQLNGKQLTHLYRFVWEDFINFHQTINLFDLSMERNENMPLFHHKKIVRITHSAGVLRDKNRNFLWENNFLSTVQFFVCLISKLTFIVFVSQKQREKRLIFCSRSNYRKIKESQKIPDILHKF